MTDQELPSEQTTQSTTHFTDNHGVVVSGSGNTLHIHINGNDVQVEKEPQRMSNEEAQNQLTALLESFDSGNMMFCIFRAMQLAGKAGTIDDAERKLRQLYNGTIPGRPYSLREIKYKINVLSFTHDTAQWNLADSPFKDQDTFSIYKFQTEKAMQLLTQSLLFDNAGRK